MKDELKNRIENERQDFEVYDTDLDSLWERIESRLDEQSTTFGNRIWMKVAASLALIAVAVWGSLSISNQNNSENQLVALSDISPDLAETELFYASQISETLQLIKTSGADVDQFVIEDLALLDSAYQELQVDLQDNVDNEEVVSAMIQNYRIKLQILEQILGEIRIKEGENEIEEVNI